MNLLPQRPSYQSERWTISTHPEGKRYARTKAAGITIITEACISEPGVSDQLDAWTAIVRDMIADKNVQLQETSHLFLELYQPGICNYYFVDHGHRSVFWLHTIDTPSVGLPHSYSSGHLRTSLKY